MLDAKLIQAFRHIDGLKDLPEAAIEALAPFAAFRNVRKGETLFCQGEPSPYCFGVLVGEVTVRCKPTQGDGPSTDFVLGPGRCIGAQSLLGEMPRPGLANVSRDGQLLSIWSSRFRSWTESQRSTAGDSPVVDAVRHVVSCVTPGP